MTPEQATAEADQLIAEARALVPQVVSYCDRVKEFVDRYNAATGDLDVEDDDLGMVVNASLMAFQAAAQRYTSSSPGSTDPYDYLPQEVTQ